MPPRIVRRLVFAPLAVLVTVAIVVLSPLLAVLALIATPSRPARRRALRLLRFSVAWLLMESAALFASLGLWLASGFGGRLRSEVSLERHYALMRWFLDSLYRRALRVFRLRVEVEEPEPTNAELAARLARPVIVLSRHAGPGDSFLLVHQLLVRYQRRPRIVMKAALQFDPSLDVVINRLPHAFVRPHRIPASRMADGAAGAPEAELDVADLTGRGTSATAAPEVGASGRGPGASLGGPGASGASAPGSGASGAGSRAPGAAAFGAGEPGSEASDPAARPVDTVVTEEIRRLASGLGPTGALVIFPEGGNFTPARQRRGIRRLEQARRFTLARRARRLRNLLPPRSGGVFAALDAAPTADVIFVAHTGLDDLITVGDVWRALPMEQMIRARWWRVPADDVPRQRDEVVPWLYDWWESIDAWIAEHRPARQV